ncbi:membrane-associated protein [Nocardia amikacinitolerans]|uniref:DedA family protein n=1 Tax=Nocardia amikacinitolerans TaxID=756689 RepID=UPI0020A562AB|nr:DedA family protein [Nocardia amikacinitolerans]MCP2298001.1 membrane-associated protein [Nocardia amikacinitolerans]
MALVAVMFWFPIGMLLPGEPFLILAGVLAPSGQLSLPLVFTAIAVTAVVSPSLAFQVGRRIDDRVERAQKDSRIVGRLLTKGEAFLLRRGELAVAIACWVPPIRAVVPLLMGAARYSFPRFLAFSAAGTTAWVAIFVIGGYLAGPIFSKYVGPISLALLAVTLAVALIARLRRRSDAKRPNLVDERN